MSAEQKTFEAVLEYFEWDHEIPNKGPFLRARLAPGITHFMYERTNGDLFFALGGKNAAGKKLVIKLEGEPPISSIS